MNQEHDDHYYVLNLSGRPYDYGFFGGRVEEFKWNDHQAPCLTTLFEVVSFAASKLKCKMSINTENELNVVAIHCNHGKGRTGTAIMSLLLYLDPQFKTIE